eukprot:4018435-Amphidinium_carterae.1
MFHSFAVRWCCKSASNKRETCKLDQCRKAEKNFLQLRWQTCKSGSTCDTSNHLWTASSRVLGELLVWSVVKIKDGCHASRAFESHY